LYRLRVDKFLNMTANLNAQMTVRDDHFNSRESRKHSGTIVELTRAADGQVKIRYTESRAKS